jgi:ribonucleoside-diphosphate reductase alpha chain
MNKNVSLAIEKAVGSISHKHHNDQKNNGPKKPDLFSLSGETELFQNERGITIKI